MAGRETHLNPARGSGPLLLLCWDWSTPCFVTARRMLIQVLLNLTKTLLSLCFCLHIRLKTPSEPGDGSNDGWVALQTNYRWKRRYFYQLPPGIRYTSHQPWSASSFFRFWCNTKTGERVLSRLLPQAWQVQHTDTPKMNHTCWMNTHTQMWTLWAMNVHSRQLETLLRHPFGWALYAPEAGH